MSGNISGQPIASRDLGPGLPAMFDRYKNRFEQELSRSVRLPEGTDPYTLIRYHLGWADQRGVTARSAISQGKAMRPTLCLFACEALEQDPDRALPAAAALELIHNFSLIHDDIQDQDVERRHQPTVWSIWGVPKALVAGDAMRSVGDVCLLNTSRYGVPPQTILKISNILTSSYLEMIQGQCLDLGFESSTEITSADYLQMIAFKTGALIRSSMEIGALLATEDPAAFQAFSTFGSCVGRAFQIRDDYLGIWGDTSLTGKSAGNDIRRRKKSFPIVYAFERASGKNREDLLRIYIQEDIDDDDVGRVLAILDDVGARDESESLTEASAEQALEAIASVSLPAWARTEAEGLVDFLARRQY
ncbi:MAG: polyprenyl synthetase family protein [Dehalococcoidia bacterium]|nr:polyprenyl synthetase family protein [Dehalococcoidia bacterium]